MKLMERVALVALTYAKDGVNLGDREAEALWQIEYPKLLAGRTRRWANHC